MIKIAVDQCVGYRGIKWLKKQGYEVVYAAKHAQPDAEWVSHAFHLDALVIISGDMDIPRIIDTEEYPMIWVSYPNDTNEVPSNKFLEHVDRKIRKKLSWIKELK